MAAAVGAPTCHRLHHLLHRPPPPSSSLSLFLKPILISTAAATTTTTTPFTHLHILRRTLISPSLPSLPSRPRLFCYSPTLPHSHSPPESSLEEEEQQTQQLEIPEEEEDNDNGEGTEIEIDNLESKEVAQVGSDSSSGLKKNLVKPPSLTVKEKKELASYAHSLGKKLKSQLVGKSGVTPSVAASFVENLESNELLKVKIHGTCPGELEDAVTQLEEATGSVIVGQIGRTVILYRPSITKLKAEEKKQELRKVFTRRKHYSRPMEFQKKSEARPRTYGRDRPTSMEFQKSEARPRTYGRDRPTSIEFQKNGDRPRVYGRDRRGRSRV